MNFSTRNKIFSAAFGVWKWKSALIKQWLPDEGACGKVLLPQLSNTLRSISRVKYIHHIGTYVGYEYHEAQIWAHAGGGRETHGGIFCIISRLGCSRAMGSSTSTALFEPQAISLCWLYKKPYFLCPVPKLAEIQHAGKQSPRTFWTVFWGMSTIGARALRVELAFHSLIYCRY